MDVNEVPVGNVPVLARYGNRTINIQYGYDGVNYTTTTSGTTLYTNSEGIIYIAGAVSGNRQVNTGDSAVYCWEIGDNLDTFYKIDGDLKVLCDLNAGSDFTMNSFCFTFLFSDVYYREQSQTAPYINQCIDANIIVPPALTSNLARLCFCLFGSTQKRVTLWKDGEWGNGSDNWGELGGTFYHYNYNTNLHLECFQISHKSWPTNRGVGELGYWVKYPEETTFYIPNELPETYAANRLQTGVSIVRYNVDDYDGNHASPEIPELI